MFDTSAFIRLLYRPSDCAHKKPEDAMIETLRRHPSLSPLGIQIPGKTLIDSISQEILLKFKSYNKPFRLSPESIAQVEVKHDLHFQIFRQ